MLQTVQRNQCGRKSSNMLLQSVVAVAVVVAVVADIGQLLSLLQGSVEVEFLQLN